MAFWTNAIDFANLPVKGTPVGGDSILIADSASTPPGQPKQALISTLPSSGGGGPSIAYIYMLR